MDGAWMTVTNDIPDIINDKDCFGASYSKITGPAETIIATNNKTNCIYLPSFGEYFDPNPLLQIDPYDHFFDYFYDTFSSFPNADHFPIRDLCSPHTHLEATLPSGYDMDFDDTLPSPQA